MTAQEFFELTREMRRAQTEYFATRHSTALSRARKLERQLDKAISNIEADGGFSAGLFNDG